MSIKRYKLSFLPLFEADLLEITDYITNNLNNPKVALRLVDNIEIAIIWQAHHTPRDSFQ